MEDKPWARISQKQYDRLPAAVKGELESLKGQRDVAVRQLQEYEDGQTPSEFWSEELICDSPGSPRASKNYIQARKVCMSIGKEKNEYIELRRDYHGRILMSSGWTQLIIVPTSSGQVEIRLEK